MERSNKQYGVDLLTHPCGIIDKNSYSQQTHQTKFLPNLKILTLGSVVRNAEVFRREWFCLSERPHKLLMLLRGFQGKFMLWMIYVAHNLYENKLIFIAYITAHCK